MTSKAVIVLFLSFRGSPLYGVQYSVSSILCVGEIALAAADRTESRIPPYA